jgi:TonB family protein
MAQIRILISLLLLFCAAARADVTVRYSLDLKFNSKLPIPPEATAKLNAFVPTEMSLRIKGDKAWSNFAMITSIADLSTGRITLLDPHTRRFATIPASAYPPYLQTVQVLPPEVQKILENIKFDVQTHKTGRQDTVRGILTEERKSAISVEIPVPQKGPVGFKLVVEQWLALPEEISRIPALGEFAAHGARAAAPLNPAGMIQRALAQTPALAERVRSAFEALAQDKRTFSAKTRVRLYAPVLALTIPGLNADEAVMELSIDVAGISSAPVPDSVFEVPADYQSASMEELLKSMQPTLPQAARSPQSSAGGVYRAGGGVTPPVMILKREPKYTPGATSDHIQGTVVLYCEVGPDGEAHNMKVVRSLRPDLDANAIEAVRGWRFKPGEKDGKPVTVAATIEVNFRLLDQ